MEIDLKTPEAIVSIVAGTLAVAATVWKIVLPLFRRTFKLHVVYAARIAELRQRPPTFVTFQVASILQPFAPLEYGFPGYSDWSIESPNWPPRAHTDSAQFFEKIAQALSGVALIQARRWEQTIDQGVSLFGSGFDSDPKMKLYQTYVRLRWFLIDKSGSDYAIVSSRIGSDCAKALRQLEDALEEMESALPTRILVVRIANRASTDARDLRIDVSAGGEIYDVTVNEQREPGTQERTTKRFSITFPVLQPHYWVDLKIWYRWKAVAFGERNLSQFDRFPGREGILINYIGISNGRARPLPSLLKDLNAWRSQNTEVGPEPGLRLPGTGI